MSEIKLCSRCDGTGELYENDRFDGWITSTCEKCTGTGRVHSTTIHFEVPYGTSLTELSDLQGKIFNLIREYESKSRNS